MNRRWLVAMLVVAVVSAIGVRGAAAAGALERVAAVQRAAVDSSPELAAAQGEVSLRGREARAEAAAVNPYVEWQSEGLGPSRTPNAQDTLRLGTTFNFFGQIGPARRLAEAAERETSRARAALAGGAAVEATRRWLELAAALERVAVRRARVDHLDLALNILEARHQLGEVAGVEVAQLDLEYSTASAELDLAESHAEALGHAVAELCGPNFPPPEIGDLEELVGGTATPSVPLVETETLAAGAPMQVADAAAALEATRSEVAAAVAWGRPLIEAEWEHFPEVEGLESFDAWGFRLSVPLPIGSVGKRQRAAARERAAAASAVRDAAFQESVRAARELLAEAEGAGQQLQTLGPLLGDLERIERSLSAQYRLGAISYLEYVYGTTRHDDVLLTTIDARQRLAAARLQLALLFNDPELFPIVELAIEEAS